MKTIKAKINFTLGSEYYIKGEPIEDLSYEQIVKLNEKGFIEPLEYEDLVILKKEIEKPKKEIKKPKYNEEEL